MTVTNLYKDRMNGVAQKKPIRPSISPVTQSNTPHVSQTWNEYYERSIWNGLLIYERNKAIINLLKESIPEDHNSEKCVGKG
ncbi:14664_t:CDS:2, partial [Gigaspora margarita]